MRLLVAAPPTQRGSFQTDGFRLELGAGALNRGRSIQCQSLRSLQVSCLLPGPRVQQDSGVVPLGPEKPPRNYSGSSSLVRVPFDLMQKRQTEKESDKLCQNKEIH